MALGEGRQENHVAVLRAHTRGIFGYHPFVYQSRYRTNGLDEQGGTEQ